MSGAVVAYDLHAAQAPRQVAVKTVGAVALLWGLIFVIGEFSETLGTSIAVLVMLVFLVARKGAVATLLGTFSTK